MWSNIQHTEKCKVIHNPNQVIPYNAGFYDSSLVNDFPTVLYTVSSLPPFCSIEKKIHTIIVLENIVIIKTVVSSRTPPKTLPQKLFPSFAQISTMNLQEKALFHFITAHRSNSGHVFRGAAFRGCGPTTVAFLCFTGACHEISTCLDENKYMHK